tara:strand:- start:366 stop:665 length:300 start_codon:yes stop_codon:yes gene_type:complete
MVLNLPPQKGSDGANYYFLNGRFHKGSPIGTTMPVGFDPKSATNQQIADDTAAGEQTQSDQATSDLNTATNYGTSNESSGTTTSSGTGTTTTASNTYCG